MIGEPILKLIPPERIDEEPKILNQLKAGKRVDHFETVRLAKDGTRLNISLTISPVKDSKGKIIGASKIARDITKQKKLLDALTESEERFRYVADTAPVMIWMTDTRKQLAFLNKRWLQFRGYDSSGVDLSKSFTDRVHPDDRNILLKTFNSYFDARREFEIEYRTKRYDGEYRWVSVCGIPRYANQSFLGFI